MPLPRDTLRSELDLPLAHPDAAALQTMGREALHWLIQHFATLPEQSIGQTGSRHELEAMLREPLPELGCAFTDVLREFSENVAPYSFRVNHPRFFAFIPSAPNYVSVLADLLCAGTNFFAGVWLEAAGPTQVELVVLDWFKELLGYPAEASGILTGGGSEANLTALVVAREPLALEQRPRSVIYLTEQRHWSIDRAARIMGLRAGQMRPVQADEQFLLQPAALQEAIRKDRKDGLYPWAVVANAGATNTGAVDPLDALADLCSAERLWLHVDAAYGWPAVLIPEERATLAGIGRADSITLDPHKWFGQPFEAGCVLVKNGRQLTQTFAMRPEYMQDVEPADEEVNFADRGIALTRRFRALKIWFSVKVLGLGWFRQLIGRCCRLADFAQALLEQAGPFEILCSRRLSIVCFRYVPAGLSLKNEHDEHLLDRLNLAIVEGVRASGRAFLSSTRLAERVALRLCFVNWRTTAADVEEVVALLKAAGEQAARNLSV
ncbi:MAG TPA: aminotransferase class V-fold PLP-dependent enzyme [Gemmataceae bacterium]|nr:aminotransferase class V-fold PLP-dependent enzyme [Gemmataceae bacterium]